MAISVSFHLHATAAYLLVFLPILTSVQAASMSFNFPTFNHDVTSGNCTLPRMNTTCLMNQASISENALYLTNDGATLSLGTAYYSEPLRLWNNSTRELANFSTSFTFQIRANDTKPGMFADGITFFLVPDASKLPEVTRGGDLGLATESNYFRGRGVTSYVAVEVDTFYNNSADWDPPFYHMGIDVNSLKSVSTVDISNFFRQLPSKGEVSVSYNGATHNLSTTLVDKDNRSYHLSYAIDLSRVLPESVFVGFSGSTGGKTQESKIMSWRFESTLEVNDTTASTGASPEQISKGKASILPKIVAPVISLLAVIGAILFMILCLWRKNRKSNETSSTAVEMDNLGPQKIPYKLLVQATENFSKDRKLGKGGSGTVYRGHLSELQSDVAIKKIPNTSDHRRKQYISEVKIISNLRHKNLIRLVGWCHERHEEFFLVYEFMPKGSLDNYLFATDEPLSWQKRYNIACGLALALNYLHEENEATVIHRDIKSSNIMLDAEFNAKLGDFGISRLTHGCETKTTDLHGTHGYIAPECFYTSKPSKLSDVYSFGIVALEIATGRMARHEAEQDKDRSLVEWVWELYGNNLLHEAADSKLGGDFNDKEMSRLLMVGLWCAHPHPPSRPLIREAIGAFRFERTVPDLPREMPLLATLKTS